MTTLTISLTGSALPGLTTNPSKSFTVSDADFQNLLNYLTAIHVKDLNPTGTTPPTNPQLLLAWVNDWIQPTIRQVQAFMTQPVQTPTPISIA